VDNLANLQLAQYTGECYSQFPQYDMLQTTSSSDQQCSSHSFEPMESVGLAIKERQKPFFDVFRAGLQKQQLAFRSP
jgi:hypothetical protein